MINGFDVWCSLNVLSGDLYSVLIGLELRRRMCGHVWNTAFSHFFVFSVNYNGLHIHHVVSD